MNIRFNRNIFLLLALPALIHGNADPKVHMASDNATAIKDEWIVVMKQSKTGSLGTMTATNAESIASSASSDKDKVVVNKIFSTSLNGFAGHMSAKAAQTLADRDDVEYVEQNAVVSVTQNSVTWGIDRVDQRDLPLSDSFSTEFSGEGVHAYIIDTGVQVSHEEFGEFGDRAIWGINTSGDGNDSDCNGHGTHVAGTVGGITYGVAKNVTIVAVKVLTCGGSGSTAGVIAGIEWAMNDAVGKKATANMSLGGGLSNAMNAAVQELHNSGVPTVVAAGNNNGNACNMSPASEPVAITVGSTTSNDARSSFSSYGTCLDIFAPGSDITSAWIGSNFTTKTISGTSMASPHVCGAAALLLSSGLSGENVTDAIRNRATINKVTDAKTGTPNKLLYVGEIGPTTEPTPQPSLQPTTSPHPTTSPTPCQGKSFEIMLITDNYPAETGWTLVNQCTNVKVAEVLRGSYTNSNTTYAKTECIPSGNYTFTITDEYNDGICCGYGSGSYTVTYDGDIVKEEGGSFESEESTTFGSCAPTTYGPTKSPTKSPTVSPTTYGPTKSPTKSPTVSPTEPPTRPCSGKIMDFILFPDDHPEDISWTLEDSQGHTILDISTPNLEANVLNKQSACLVAQDCYTLTIRDLWKDGICCSSGNGYYTISWSGDKINGDGNFGDEQVTQFGDACASTAPTENSVNQPITTPTSLPTIASEGIFINSFNLQITKYASNYEAKFKITVHAENTGKIGSVSTVLVYTVGSSDERHTLTSTSGGSGKVSLKADMVLNSETITVVDVSLMLMGYTYRPGLNTAEETDCDALFIDTCDNLIISLDGIVY